MEVVSNVKVYDLEESILASGLPMRTTVPNREINEKDIERCKKLVNATNTGNNAHAQFLTGIRVNFDLTFTNKAWIECERYRFMEFISSQSTMHRIVKFNLDESYIEYVDKRIIDIMKEKVEAYNRLVKLKENMIKDNVRLELLQETEDKIKEAYLEILYSNPSGFKLTARMTTNYRCLRNIYIQRKNHRLPEWRAFCSWIEALPYAKELIIGENINET